MAGIWTGLSLLSTKCECGRHIDSPAQCPGIQRSPNQVAKKKRLVDIAGRAPNDVADAGARIKRELKLFTPSPSPFGHLRPIAGTRRTLAEPPRLI